MIKSLFYCDGVFIVKFFGLLETSTVTVDVIMTVDEILKTAELRVCKELNLYNSVSSFINWNVFEIFFLVNSEFISEPPVSTIRGREREF